MSILVSRIEFSNVKQLKEALDKSLGGLVSEEDVSINDWCGDSLGVLSLFQNTLSDGSVVFDLYLEPTPLDRDL